MNLGGDDTARTRRGVLEPLIFGAKVYKNRNTLKAFFDKKSKKRLLFHEIVFAKT